MQVDNNLAKLKKQWICYLEIYKQIQLITIDHRVAKNVSTYFISPTTNEYDGMLFHSLLSFIWRSVTLNPIIRTIYYYLYLPTGTIRVWKHY